MKMKKIAFLYLILFSTSLAAQSPEALLKTINDQFDKEVAYKTTAYVEQFWRDPGNAGFDSSIYYVANLLEKAGYVAEDQAKATARLTYRIEKLPMKDPAWEPVGASLSLYGDEAEVLNFKTNRNMIAINSHATNGNIKAEVVHYSSGNIQGKVIYGEAHPWTLYRKALSGGAIGVLSYRMPNYTKPEIHQTSIQFASIPYGEKPLWAICLSYAANQKMKKALKRGKTTIDVSIQTKFYKADELTLIADIKGSKQAEKRFVYSAHVQEPGANDNASGVGVLGEMACAAAQLLQTKTIDPARTLTFIWGNEIASTRQYIAQDKNRKANIMWGLSLDMVGEDTEKTGGSFLIEKMPDPSAIWTRGNDKHTEWGAGNVSQSDFIAHYFTDVATHICKTRAKENDWRVETNPFEGGSDHTPFLDANIPGLLFWHFTDVFYHTDNDRIDKVSKETLKNVGSSALALGLFLTAGTNETAKASLELVEAAAYQRLETEFNLSKELLKSESNLKKESKILKAWTAWYSKALNSTREIPIGGGSIKFKQQMVKAVMDLEKKGEFYLKELEK